jgi:hypothetical protein
MVIDDDVAGDAPAAGDTDADAAPIMDDMADASFTIHPMELDTAEFADAGFATAADFEPGHFDDPEEEELLAERIVAAPANPFPAPVQAPAGPSTHPHAQPPTHDEIQASIATVGEQIQLLVLSDAARRLEIDEVRQAGLVNSSRLDDTQLTIKEMQQMYTSLIQDHDQTKAQLQEALTQLSDFIRYFTNGQQIEPASHTRMSGLAYYTNSHPSPNLRQLAEETFTGIFSNPPSICPPPRRFDSASHSGPALPPLANRPVTRRAASNMLPQRQVASSISRANMPRAATATMKGTEGSPKGKGKGKGNGKGKAQGKGKAMGKGKGMQKAKGEGIGKGKGKARAEDEDEDEDAAGDEEDDDPECSE